MTESVAQLGSPGTPCLALSCIRWFAARLMGGQLGESLDFALCRLRWSSRGYRCKQIAPSYPHIPGAPALHHLESEFDFAHLHRQLEGSVLTEIIFSWPGIGSYAIEALVASDYAAVQGFVLSMALLFTFVNLLVDITLTLIDPRVALDS